MTALLQVAGVVAGYGGSHILHGVSLEVLPGEVVCVVGPNGAGKSTLMKVVAGLVVPESGSVSLAGRDLAGVPPERRVRLGIGYVPQERNVFPSLTVEENLELGAFADPGSFRERRERVTALFPFLRRAGRRRAGDLSGGERQMVAFGRALMGGPRLLLLDEPSAGLAPRAADEVFRHVREVNRAGVTVLMIEQNVRRALEASDRGCVLATGRVALEGAGRELLADDRVGRLYLGECG